jgi:hypothetical protein
LSYGSSVGRVVKGRDGGRRMSLFKRPMPSEADSDGGGHQAQAPGLRQVRRPKVRQAAQPGS